MNRLVINGLSQDMTHPQTPPFVRERVWWHLSVFLALQAQHSCLANPLEALWFLCDTASCCEATEDVGHDHVWPFRNLINTMYVCWFSHYCAKYGGQKFMLSPKGMDLANNCLVLILERVYLCRGTFRGAWGGAFAPPRELLTLQYKIKCSSGFKCYSLPYFAP